MPSKSPKSSNSSVQRESTKLGVPFEEASRNLMERIEAGRDFLNVTINTKTALMEAKKQEQLWHEYNCELLGRMFTDDSIREEYRHVNDMRGFIIGGPTTLNGDIEDFRDNLEQLITKLLSIHGRLPLIPEANKTVDHKMTNVPSGDSIKNANDIFIVHGHDGGSKETLARYIEKIDLNPVILHEQPSRGNTIIEKLEYYASRASFAVVLLTPDDVGYPKDKEEFKQARARQNVILELGYFLARLQRDHVCVLYKPGVEVPSDYSGVLFIEMDSYGAWKNALIKELNAAGFQIDLSKALLG